MKNAIDAKDLMASFIPMGMIFGCAIGVVIGIFSSRACYLQLFWEL